MRMATIFSFAVSYDMPEHCVDLLSQSLDLNLEISPDIFMLACGIIGLRGKV